MQRYWKVYRTFFSSSLVREMEFRANFFAKILRNLIWIGFFLLILLVIYGNTDEIAGWNRNESFILTATSFLLNAVISGAFFSVQEIPEQVRMGKLDFVVTRPIDSQFWVSSRRVNFDQVGTLCGGLALLSYGTTEAGIDANALQWLGYGILVLCAIAIFYSMMLILMSTGIWFVRVDNLWVLADSVLEVSRFPLDIYGMNVRRFLTYVLPLGFLATFPARQLVNGWDSGMVGLGLVWAFGSLAVSRAFWLFALRFYGSASS